MLNNHVLLNNPENPAFNLNEAEIYLFKEAHELISIKHYSYSLFAIWNAVIINLQRRIEFFGIKNFLSIVEQKENYNENGISLKDRWLNINEFKTVGYARKLDLISHTCHDLITMLYWMKSSTNEKAHKNIDQEEIFCVLYLLEKNLLIKEFKEDKRVENNPSNQNNLQRRKEDSTDSNKSQLEQNKIHTVHEDFMLKNSMKEFEKQTKDEDENEHLIDKYI